MSGRRLKIVGGVAVYHCISRVVGGQMLLGDNEKEVFRAQMWRVAAFCGCEILTYCLMDNHVHLLIRIPYHSHLTDEELVKRFSVLYPEPTAYQPMSAETLEAKLKENSSESVRIRESLTARMGDVSEFMKTLKQRFSNWYNKSNGRYGTFWSDRFKSLLVSNAKNSKLVVAAYIDLNPVRAGIIEDPKDYRFSGYGEAVGGSNSAREGICCVLENKNIRRTLTLYREIIFIKGSTPKKGNSNSGVISKEASEQVIHKRGRLSYLEILHCRIRYFSDGLILGDKNFVEEHFHKFREFFGKNRVSGARAMRHKSFDGLFVARDLQSNIMDT